MAIFIEKSNIGKPSEMVGRKAMGLTAYAYDCQAALGTFSKQPKK